LLLTAFHKLLQPNRRFILKIDFNIRDGLEGPNYSRTAKFYYI